MKLNNKIIELIKSDSKYNRFQEITALVNEDQEIKLKLSKVKRQQQELVNIKRLDKNNAIKALQKEYQMSMDDLMKIPILNEYLDLVNYYNELMLMIKDILETEIHDFFNKK